MCLLYLPLNLMESLAERGALGFGFIEVMELLFSLLE